MAIQVSGTEVISNARELSNIASVDATTVTSLNDAGVGGGFKPVSVSGATQALNVGTYNFFDGGSLSADTTLTFTSVPTDALWTYTAKAGLDEAYTLVNSYYSGLSKSVIAQEDSTTALAFSSDGTKMYVLGYTNATVYQYTLSPAFNIATATDSGLSKSVSAEGASPYGLAFSSDGTKMYMSASSIIWQYNLGTAWNVSTATYVANKSVYAQETLARGVTFSSDGTKMYIVGESEDAVLQYTLGTAWSVSTATYASLRKNADDSAPQDVAFSSDGTRMVVVGNTNNAVFQYTLGTAWAINTATYDSLAISTAASIAETTPRSVAFNSDGTRMYIVGQSTNTVFEFYSSVATTLTLPAAVENPPSTVFFPYDQVAYTFVTNDGGTTVKLIGEEAC
jgi:sugar lactone lactonase YvrE